MDINEYKIDTIVCYVVCGYTREKSLMCGRIYTSELMLMSSVDKSEAAVEFLHTLVESSHQQQSRFHEAHGVKMLSTELDCGEHQ